MKKFLITLLCLTTCVFAAGFVACAQEGDDRDNKQSNIYGEDDGDYTDNF